MNKMVESMVFEKLWSIWPKKDLAKKPSARKGFSLVNTSQDLDQKRIIKCAEIYVASIDEEKYCHELGNWFRNGHYLDIYSSFEEIDELHRAVSKESAAAEGLVKAWNEACQPHWIKVQAFKEREQTAKDALNNLFFSHNWKRALADAQKIFRKEFNPGDWRAKVEPSFTWFCRCRYESHTVARIIEGEFGRALDPVKPKQIEPIKSSSPEEVNSIFDQFDVFKNSEKPRDIIVDESAEEGDDDGERFGL